MGCAGHGPLLAARGARNKAPRAPFSPVPPRYAVAPTRSAPLHPQCPSPGARAALPGSGGARCGARGIAAPSAPSAPHHASDLCADLLMERTVFPSRLGPEGERKLCCGARGAACVRVCARAAFAVRCCGRAGRRARAPSWEASSRARCLLSRRHFWRLPRIVVGKVTLCRSGLPASTTKNTGAARLLFCQMRFLQTCFKRVHVGLSPAVPVEWQSLDNLDKWWACVKHADNAIVCSAWIKMAL